SPLSPRTSWNIPPHLQAQSRQLRQPKSPLYVPAVLRPTEKPTRQSPPKGNRLSYGSVENIMDGEGTMTAADGSLMGLSRSGSVTDDWTAEVIHPCTGPPTRSHWKLDSTSSTCDDKNCDKYFSFFERRHHCRRCGNIFCGEHSSQVVPLDQNTRFHPQGHQLRACNKCGSDYRDWEVARVSRSNSTNSRESTTPSTPIINRGMNRLGQAAQRVGSMGKSVPDNWNWSTF
ncbi:hypothetical protein EJ08DRAFT_554693, partial [Tothia fuscella]